MAKIVTIEETKNFIPSPSSYSNRDGFVVTLDDGEKIAMYISNSQNCCENWGYFMTNDDVKDFIGAEVFSVEKVDKLLHSSTIDLEEATCHAAGEYSDGGGIMFVNIHTSNGVLQFVAYNSHNGYYGHEAGVVSRYFNHTEDL